MSVKIIYNGKDAFSPYPLPFVGLNTTNIYYGELWGEEDEITLRGQLTGCTFDQVYSGFNLIKGNFAKSYQPLEIWEENGGVSGKIFESKIAEIKSISMESSRWVGILPYTINITSYPSGFFSGKFGILDPVDTWQNQETNDFRGNITHTISCRGINTSNQSNNALENAREWAWGRSGSLSYVTPAFIENISTGALLLLTVEESIDRFNGVYSVTENYTTDLTRSGYGVIRYTTSFESGNNLISVALNGTVEGSQKNMTLVRSGFNNLDKYGAALLSYQRVFNKNDINPIPLSYGVSEDPNEARISFNYIFNNDNSPEVVFDYKVGIVSGDIITANINGTIVARGGDVKAKLSRSLAYSSGINLFQLTTDFYNQFYPKFAQNPLNNLPVSSGISIDEFQGTVSLSANFSNSINPTGFPVFNYTMGFVPSLNQFDSKIALGGIGLYSVVDLGYANRANFTINGDCVIGESLTSDQGVAAIKNKAMTSLTDRGLNSNLILENSIINFNRYDKKVVSFSFGWSFDISNRVVVLPDYDKVNTFRLK